MIASVGLRPIFLHVAPIDLDPEAGGFGQIYRTAPGMGTTAIDVVVDWVAGRVSHRFGGESGIAKRRDQVAVDMRHGVRRDGNALLLRVVRYAQRFGEARVPRGIE